MCLRLRLSSLRSAKFDVEATNVFASFFQFARGKQDFAVPLNSPPTFFQIYPPAIVFDSTRVIRGNLSSRESPLLSPPSFKLNSRGEVIRPRRKRKLLIYLKPLTVKREGEGSWKIFAYARGSESCISSNEFLFDPGITEVANGPCRRANMPEPLFPFAEGATELKAAGASKRSWKTPSLA